MLAGMDSLPTAESSHHQTRERIIRAGMDLFRKRGFHNTSLAQILERAAITKGGFYFYFRSKDELGFAVLDFVKNFWNENVIAAVAHEPDARSRIHRMVEIMTQMNRGEIFHGSALLAVLMAEMMETNSEFSEEIKKIQSDWQKSMVDILEEGKREGILRKNTDSNALALVLIACCQGTTMIGHLDPQRINFEPLLYDLERWVLEGIHAK
jgi:TetR/AcrR family transcriptional repressor of nem operon